MTITSEATTTATSELNTAMISDKTAQLQNEISEKPASHLSYFIRPTNPCVFGRETYDEKSLNEDEFFLTAGAIIHSCPNIYESSLASHYRRLHSCEHLPCLTSTTTKLSINDYDPQLDRYSICPRFQPILSSTSLSTDSGNSEIELYKERHANGLSRNCEDPTSSLPTSWKSDNYLQASSIRTRHRKTFSSISNDNNKRSQEKMVHTTQTASTATSSSGSSKVHTAQAENVHVQSVVQTETQSKVSIENTKKINDLMARLGSTHLQVDEYSRRRTEEISEAVTESISKIVAETQIQQQQLLADANARTAAIENDFKLRIQEYVAKLDAEKATLLATLEKELNLRQEDILASARQRIDDLNEEANRLKMGVLREAQAQSNAKINQITEQVVALGHEDASRRLATTTTTVITTKAAAASETHAEGATVTLGRTHVESSHSASSSSASSAHLEANRR